MSLTIWITSTIPRQTWQTTSNFHYLCKNVRLMYLEQRRTGLIDGPEDFDCDIKWRRTR